MRSLGVTKVDATCVGYLTASALQDWYNSMLVSSAKPSGLPGSEHPKGVGDMRIFLIVAAFCLLATSTQAFAAMATSFECGDHDSSLCSCAGPADSRDCRGMKKNCSGPITCGGLLERCTCKYTAPFTGTGGGLLHGTTGPKTTFTPPGRRLPHGTTGVKVQ